MIANHKYNDAIPALQTAYRLDPKNLDHGKDAANLLWAIRTPDTLQQGIVAAWRQTRAFAKDIGVGAGGAVWIAATDDQEGKNKSIYRWSGSKWEKIPGAADRIAVDPDGSAWIVTPDQTVAHWKDGQWVTLPGAANDIGVGPDGSVWIIGTGKHDGGYDIFHWNGNGWDTSDGAAYRIAVDTYGKPWLVNTDAWTFDKINGQWQNHGGPAIDIGAGLTGSIWALRSASSPDTRKLLHWNGAEWDAFPGQGVAISVGPNGLPWVVCADGSIQAGPTL